MGRGLIWHVGKDKLGCMISEISKIAKLSTQYMKHCILEIAITALDQAVFASHHIMSVSGIEVKHRSKVIQGKLQRTKKGKC
jgi:hypothetical protein